MAGDSKGTRSEKDSNSLVADLLRRVTSPEVLAGVAGAGAAAYFTKHMVEESDETEAEEQPELEDREEAHAADEDEPGEDEQEDQPEAAAVEDQSDEDEPDEDGQEQPEDAEPEQPEDAEPEQPEDAEREEPEDAEQDGEQRALRDASEDADEAESDDDDGEVEDEGEEASDGSADSNGSLGSDDERMELLDQARSYAEQLTGHPVESISSLGKDDDGWRIGMEVVELSRVPSTTDVLGSYELVLNGDGDLVDFRRGHRYTRNATDEGS